MPTRAHVTPAVLRWARESAGFELEDAAAGIGVNSERLAQAELGQWQLTLRQAEAAARLYERPLAALFVSSPPEEESLERQFRRLPGAPELPWPRQMRSLARRVRERQEAAAALYELRDETPLWTALDLQYTEDPQELAAQTREMLGVPLDEQKAWRDYSGYQPLREWIDAIEALGVLTTQDGSLPVNDMRGFASTHPLVPAIVVNTNDDPPARAFTAVHELGHLLRARAGEPPLPSSEVWCNDFASSILMPASAFAADFQATAADFQATDAELLSKVDSLAIEYGVTPHAAAVRAARLQLARQREVDNVIHAIQERARIREPGEGGGNYYRTTVARLGPAFIQLVMGAVDNQVVTYPAAAGLLGVKVNNFRKLRETIAARGR